MIVLSPHLDDAVLSCGELIACRKDVLGHETECHVVTVFAGVPGELPLTHFDANSGFVSAEQAVTSRRQENARACAVLDAKPTNYDYFDRQYGLGADGVAFWQQLRHLHTIDEDPVFIPLGLSHPDHEVVSNTALAAATGRGAGSLVYLYEDLPARVLWPERVVERRDELEKMGWQLGAMLNVPRHQVDRKRAAIYCYPSQLWAVDVHACLAPERIWMATWHG